MTMRSVEVKRTRFAAAGWTFDEHHPGSCWEVIASNGSRTVVARSHDREKAWEAAIEQIERVPPQPA